MRSSFLHAKSLSNVWLFVTPWTIACQTPLSMRFSRQEYWSGSLFHPPGDLSNPGIKPTSIVSPALAGGFFTTLPPGKPFHSHSYLIGKKTEALRTEAPQGNSNVGWRRTRDRFPTWVILWISCNSEHRNFEFPQQYGNFPLDIKKSKRVRGHVFCLFVCFFIILTWKRNSKLNWDTAI